MTAMCTAIANYLIERTNEYNENQTHFKRILLSSKRLQKLLYFSDVMYMMEHNGTSMFNDEFYAWTSGPVIPEVYRKFQKYQNGVMLPINMDEYKKPCEAYSNTLDNVFQRTVDISTATLINESHIKGGPWDQVYDASDSLHLQIISKKSIYEFYSENPQALAFLQAS